MTKSLTALTIWKLMEMDSIDINKSVYSYIKKLPKKKYDFTVKDVGVHLVELYEFQMEKDTIVKIRILKQTFIILLKKIIYNLNQKNKLVTVIMDINYLD